MLSWAITAVLGIAVGSALASSPAAAGDRRDDPPVRSVFSEDTLNVTGDRLGFGSNRGATTGGQGFDWDEAWQDYIDGLVQECRDGAAGQLDRARCDDMVIVRGPGAEGEPAAAVPAITMSDLERFAPVVGELVVEPDGWGVVGTPTNFYATAESHTMEGELFGSPVEVRWTPTSYVFDYGDGTVHESEASGAAWRGTQESWSETATSHTYASTDDVTASVTVVFTAEVDAGSGWFAVPGTLAVEAPAVSVKVFEVDTVLTDGDCMANPTAPGC